MLRRGLPGLPRSLLAVHNRSFVSTVLLSRKWDNETVVELRKEARARGLSTKGNKPTLVARIQGHEESKLDLTSQSTPPVHAPSATRSASTKVAPPASSAISQADSPGIPLSARPNNTPPPHSDFLAIKLPDLSKPVFDAPVQIPYLPDIWDSANSKEIAPKDVEPEPPKVHVVSGSATHYAGGPTHNLEKLQESDVSPTPTTVQPTEPWTSSNEEGTLADLWESLGLPRSFSARRALSDAGKQVVQAFKEKHDEVRVESRPLTNEERRGVYVLLGIIGGSWLLSSLVNPPTVDETHSHTD